jgi:regulator of sigma E protease
LNLLPLGGFVKIHGEDGGKKDDLNKNRAFYSKPIGVRSRIIVAGVTMNLILAAFLLSLGYWIGSPNIIEDNEPGILKDPRVQITQIALNSPADMAGIKVGDTIAGLRAGGQELKVATVVGTQEFIGRYKGEEIIFIIQRGDQALEKNLVLRSEYPADQGLSGIALARTAIVSYPWYQALFKGIISALSLTWFIITALGGILWNLIITGKLGVDIAGPVGIFNLTSQAAQLGFIYVLQLAVILNINLAIINVLPIPALDGGRLLFLAIEKVKGSPLNQKFERYANMTGFVLLIILMIVVTWRDIIRVF